jgi:isovaleryl-CoA dehydrogenase
MLFANNLQINGNDEQRNKYLPDACTGKKVCGMCMTEPGAGTDVLGMQMTAVRRGDTYLLNGAKMWITNGAVSDTELGDTFLVYARVEGGSRNQLSMFIVEKGFAGFSLGQKIKGKLGMRASTTAELVFDDCQVPAENLVGSEGAATLHMMRNLELERVALAGMSLGIARRSIEVMNRYASERTSFGKPLREFGQIQRYISQSYADYMAGRAYAYYTASTMSLETPGHRLDSDGVKLFTSTMAKDVADRAIQVLGGYGYVSEYAVERLWRDAKLLEIGGGTLEAHQKNMCRELARSERIL